MFSKVYGIEVKSPQGVNTGTEISNKDIEETEKFIFDNKIKEIFVERTNNPDKMKNKRNCKI
ncbi:zinc ABC transporter substrate-binding protein [Helcococcus bovis]|uniref:metal ABC transporter solute-binding protein, Zn/Mn family n=1 Tax=Helcococcus bovis TaxID=3153252 RepID=UPI0038BCD39C